MTDYQETISNLKSQGAIEQTKPIEGDIDKMSGTYFFVMENGPYKFVNVAVLGENRHYHVYVFDADTEVSIDGFIGVAKTTGGKL